MSFALIIVLKGKYIVLQYLIEKNQSILAVIMVLLISWSFAGTTNSLIVASLSNDSKKSDKKGDSSLALNRFRRQRRSINNYQIINDRNIFDSQNRKPKAKVSKVVDNEPKPFPTDQPPVKSNIKARLLGTMVFANPKFSFATIHELSGDQETKNLYVDDKILKKARITKIQRNRIYIVNNNRNEYMEVEGTENMTGPPAVPRARRATASNSKSTIRRQGNKVTIDQREVASALENMGTIAMQARVVPNFINGKVNGFKIFAIKPGSIYQKLGVRNGDVIQNINGFEMNSPEKALQVYTQLRNEKNINIDLIRRGKKQTMQIEIR